MTTILHRPLYLLVAAMVAVTGLLVLTTPRASEAHPLGNFTVNRLALVQLQASGGVQLRYVVDMAEIPAFTEIRRLDRDGDGFLSDSEAAPYLQTTAEEVARKLDLRIGGARVELAPGGTALSTPQGQGGLKTLRLVLDYGASLAGGWQGGAEATLRDTNHDGRLGWRDIVITAGEGVALSRTSASLVDETAELTAYPESLLKSPPDVREVRFEFAAGDSSLSPVQPSPSGKTAESQGKTLDRFAGLVSSENLTPAFVALSLLAAMAWGAAHALGPGHGKTIVAAYLVGSRGTAKHALLLGLTVTATHTSAVYALGLVTLFASSLIDAQDLYLWLSVGSGVMVVGMGLALFATRLRGALKGRSNHGHSHDFVPEHAPGHGESHSHGPEQTLDARMWSQRLKHSVKPRAHERHSHSHGHGHSHLPTQTGLKGLIALGVSGGLLPCPTALVVMLGAIALDRTAYGLALVLAFSVGLAGVLTGIGLLLVYARRLLEGPGNRLRLLSPNFTRRAITALPVLSSLAIVAAGVLITSSALSVG